MAGFENFLVRLSLEIIQAYDFSVPLHRYLATWFRQRKKLGSRDRRGIRELVYSYYRLGKCLSDLSMESRLQISLYLTQEKPSEFIKQVLSESVFAEEQHPEFSERLRKIEALYPAFNIRDLFPFNSALSEGTDAYQLQLSALQQPLVWIRIRKQQKDSVYNELEKKAIAPVVVYAPEILGFVPAVDLESLESFQEGRFEIQDLSSQLTSEYYNAEAGEKWWDCCAASGGKSLLLLNKEPELKLTVSDIRKTTLLNLTERFNRNKYNLPEIIVADLTRGEVPQLEGRQFDGILVDAPCSGSGTWSRTPEMLSAFNQNQLPILQQIQQTILRNALRYIKPGGKVIYMTCSVFAAENENVIENVLNGNEEFEVEDRKLIQGAGKRADSLFVARLIRK